MLSNFKRLFFFGVIIFVSGCSIMNKGHGPSAQKILIESDTFSIKDKHMHMMGPMQNKFFYFENTGSPEILWVNSFNTKIIVDDKLVESSHLMCHNTIEKNRKAKLKTPKLFEKTKGWFIGVSSSNHLNTQFPEGFAVPVSTADQFFVNSQVANHKELKTPKRLRYKTEINYTKDSELESSPRPLFRRTLMALTPRFEGYCQFGKKGLRGPTSQGQCSRQKAMMRHKGYHDSIDKYGQVFSSHWMAKPGKTLNRTLVSEVLDIPSDTKIHYISAHIHSGVKSIKLVDLTKNEVIYENKVFKKGHHDQTEFYSSKEGIPLFKDHDYEMITLVENDKNHNIDIMAMLYVYMEDHNFKRL